MATSPTPQRPGDDWPAQVAATVERVVHTVRDRTTRPVIFIVRAVVFGLLAGFLGVMALVLLAIGVVRGLDVAIPGEVWSAHLVAGIVFTVAGAVLWRFRRAPAVD